MTYTDAFDALFDALFAAVADEVPAAYEFVTCRGDPAGRAEALHIVMAKCMADAVMACAEEARDERKGRRAGC